ncbi:MAG: hypothetical protein PUE72_01065 [Lachnospiraceae bacterium]|nr:hypothetical protein [Lachnospiraceae bacterium]
MDTAKTQLSEMENRKIQWKYLAEHHCYLWERAPYCSNPEVPAEQCMNIYVPEHFLTENGELTEQIDENGFNAKTVPVIFENGLAGYHEAEPFDLEDPRSAAKEFLKNGFVYVSCGCRGRSSENIDKKRCGKSPISLVDLKAGIRFLKHLAGVIPGDMTRIVSVGISAGGAMSTLLGATGNSKDYEEELRRAGAVMEESDDVFAAQCYCPIIDLDHADLAYEWMFRGETHYKGMPFVGFGEGDLTPYAAALSERMADAYPDYFNSLGLTDPISGEAITIGKGLEGSGYKYLMKKLEQSAAKYFKKLNSGEALSGPEIRVLDHLETAEESSGKKSVSVTDYIAGNYELLMKNRQSGESKWVAGEDKSGWLIWDGEKAGITGMKEMQKTYHTRLKLCPAFDDLNLIQAENQEFGTPQCDKMHFDPYLAPIMETLQKEFPKENAKYLEGYREVNKDRELEKRRAQINPMNYIGKAENSSAPHFRIRVGSKDSDTSLMITLTLALKLMQTGTTDVDYEIVWDEPHGRADYPGEVTAWVKKIAAAD